MSSLDVPSVRLSPVDHLDLTIFVISLNAPDSSDANYLECANFSGVLHDSKRLFRCGAQGLVGEYVYIRDNRHHLAYLTLCEVEVFALGGGFLLPEAVRVGTVRVQPRCVNNLSASSWCYSAH